MPRVSLASRRQARPVIATEPVARFDAVPLLTIYIALLCIIPARWVLPGLGSAGPPASVFGMGLLVLWGCIQLVPHISTHRTLLRWPLLLNALILLVSYGLGQDRGLTSAESLSSDRALLQLASLSGVMLMVSEGLPTMAHVSRFTKRLVIFAVIVAGIGLVQFTTGYDPLTSIRWPGLVLNSDISGLRARGGNRFIRVKGTTLHPIEFAALMAMAVPLALHHATHEINRARRQRWYVATAILGVAALLAVSRTAVVGIAFAGIVMFWGWSPKFRLRALGLGAIFIVGIQFVVPGLLGTLKGLFLNIGTDSSTTARTDDYSQVGRYVADRPWFGRGTGTWLADEYIVLDNRYLYRVATTGYVGLAILFVLLFGGLLMARHAARRHPSNKVRHLAVAVAAMVAVGIVGGATFDLHSFPTANGFLTVALGLAAVLAQLKTPIPYADELAPKGLLRLSYRAEHVDRSWWYRFDPELRATPVTKDAGDLLSDQAVDDLDDSSRSQPANPRRA